MQQQFTPVPIDDDENVPLASLQTSAEERAAFLQAVQLEELIDDSPNDSDSSSHSATPGTCVKLFILLLLLGAVFFGSSRHSDHQTGVFLVTSNNP
jgi:hypothetical protein